MVDKLVVPQFVKVGAHDTATVQTAGERVGAVLAVIFDGMNHNRVVHHSCVVI